MEERRSTGLRHKEWRRIAKSERRRRIRRREAQERDANRERLRAALERNMEYLNWRAEQQKEEMEKEMREREEHTEQERLWIDREIDAQKKWQILQEQELKDKQQKLEEHNETLKKLKALHETIQKKKEEEKRKHEEAIRIKEQLRKDINDYIDNGTRTPEALREIADSQPRRELCPFFTKTGVCRYREMCSKNHRTIYLSKVILIPGFYLHFSLEKNSAEYDTDVRLEYESSEMLNHFRIFYEDVISELESFGRIKTLKCCCNIESHLRGNMYIEYYTEREAARAWRNLAGRWYGGRQLTCQFVNLTSWRSAVCGMSKCPKGNAACNFLHTFKNPHDQYDIKSPPRLKGTPQDANSSRRSEHRSKSEWEESDRDNGARDRSWRWSESPEPESDRRSRSSKTDNSARRERSPRSSRDRRHSQSERSRMRRSNSNTPFKEHRRSNRNKTYDKKVKDKDTISDDRSSKRRRSKSRSDSENNHKDFKRKH